MLFTGLSVIKAVIPSLLEIDQDCRERMERLIHRIAEVEGDNEQMKASDQLGQVSRMNSIQQRAEKTDLAELIFDHSSHTAYSGATFDFLSPITRWNRITCSVGESFLS